MRRVLIPKLSRLERKLMMWCPVTITSEFQAFCLVTKRKVRMQCAHKYERPYEEPPAHVMYQADRLIS